MNYSQTRIAPIARQQGQHRHSYAQVLIGWRGQLACEFDNGAGELAASGAALVPAAAGHLYAGLDDDCALVVVDVALHEPYIRALEQACGIAFSETLFSQPEFITLDAEMAPLLEFTAQRLAHGRGSDDAAGRCQLLSMLMTQVCRSYSSERTRALHQRLDRGVLDAYIDRHLEAPPDNRTLAAALNLSESHCYCLFQRQFGLTPQQYVMQRRLHHARFLLRSSRLTLAAIADRVGFADASSFSRAYKKLFQQPPGRSRHGTRG